LFVGRAVFLELRNSQACFVVPPRYGRGRQIELYVNSHTILSYKIRSSELIQDKNLSQILAGSNFTFLNGASLLYVLGNFYLYLNEDLTR
jgi:hypothetical protein